MTKNEKLAIKQMLDGLGNMFMFMENKDDLPECIYDAMLACLRASNRIALAELEQERLKVMNNADDDDDF